MSVLSREIYEGLRNSYEFVYDELEYKEEIIMPLMKCGHTSQGYDQNGNPVCVICVGIIEGARIIEDKLPDLTNRKAKCTCCSNTAYSKFNLAFFEYKPKNTTDAYYCGCLGWD